MPNDNFNHNFNYINDFLRFIGLVKSLKVYRRFDKSRLENSDTIIVKGVILPLNKERNNSEGIFSASNSFEVYMVNPKGAKWDLKVGDVIQDGDLYLYVDSIEFLDNRKDLVKVTAYETPRKS